MGQYDFTYEMPQNFNSRVIQFLQQKGRNNLAAAFQKCKYEYEDIGNAYRAGIRGDNWNMNALDFIFEGSEKNIKLLENNKVILKETIGMALKSRESGFQVHDIYFLEPVSDIDVFPKSAEERFFIDLTAANFVLKDLIWIGERICTNAAYNENSKEDSINDYFRDMLCSKGYSETKDQTRHGISENGKSAGEVDILLSKDSKEIALFEGIIPRSSTDSRIGEHIDKAINNYNALGTATFIVAYVINADYDGFWKKYYNHISNHQYNMKIKKSMTELPSTNASTKIAQIILSIDGFDFPVFFLCFKIRK